MLVKAVAGTVDSASQGVQSRWAAVWCSDWWRPSGRIQDPREGGTRRSQLGARVGRVSPGPLFLWPLLSRQ